MKKSATLSTARIIRHLLLWLVVWLFIRYIIVGVYIKDTLPVLTILSVITFSKTVVLFYLFGYFILPQYLYRFRFLPFTLFFLLIYYGVYLTDYATSYYLHDISNNANTGLMVHTKRGWALVESAGLLGCFTNPEVSFMTASNSFFFVSMILTGKVVKDLLTYRTRTLLIERDTIEMERTNLTLERDNLALELDLLKAQVNPHFLFNALNSIYARVVDANEPAAELVLRLAELMRYNLYETNVEKIALADEIAYIENYLSLERMRHASLVEVIFSADDDFSGYQIAPLILIAFVENAFKHGLGSGLTTAYVLVDIQLQDTTFFFTVQNSLPQSKRAVTAKKSGGVGLPNIKKRLSLLYPDRYQLDISQTATSYSTTLRLQLDPVQ